MRTIEEERGLERTEPPQWREELTFFLGLALQQHGRFARPFWLGLPRSSVSCSRGVHPEIPHESIDVLAEQFHQRIFPLRQRRGGPYPDPAARHWFNLGLQIIGTLPYPAVNRDIQRADQAIALLFLAAHETEVVCGGFRGIA